MIATVRRALSPEVAKDYVAVEYDPKKGYPARFWRYYRCSICGDIISAAPMTSMTCTCGNLFIETGTVRVKNHEYEPDLLRKRSFFQKVMDGK